MTVLENQNFSDGGLTEKCLWEKNENMWSYFIFGLWSVVPMHLFAFNFGASSVGDIMPFAWIVTGTYDTCSLTIILLYVYIHTH